MTLKMNGALICKQDIAELFILAGAPFCKGQSGNSVCFSDNLTISWGSLSPAWLLTYYFNGTQKRAYSHFFTEQSEISEISVSNTKNLIFGQ